ncbi:SH3 domain-containing protein [Candidatus Gottesmanbacteria bacterium]|nr:SH3 domain-containing protein [Candidatus Gottesmanbacteria bacterium]MBI5452299.1 SH3 domain-containing protein [Candidatus Gottesmanbacteria bacterium]
MKKRAILVVIVLVVIIGYSAYTFIFARTPDISGLKINATPPADIFLNDKLVGKTPYDDKYRTGEYVLKLIPQDSTASSSAWQGKIKLNPNVLTFVNRDLGPSELTSSGEILTLEKISQNEAQLNVFSIPDAAIVLLDGVERGVSPLFSGDLTPGEHDVAVVSPGYVGRTVRVQLTTGYKLIINFQLALSKKEEAIVGEATPTPSLTSPVAQGKPYVLIKETETGFLRVRSSPSKSATETAQVKPGDKYPFLDEQEGWYKISYDGKEGWISNRYAEKKQ